MSVKVTQKRVKDINIPKLTNRFCRIVELIIRAKYFCNIIVRVLKSAPILINAALADIIECHKLLTFTDKIFYDSHFFPVVCSEVNLLDFHSKTSNNPAAYILRNMIVSRSKFGFPSEFNNVIFTFNGNPNFSLCTAIDSITSRIDIIFHNSHPSPAIVSLEY